MEKIKFNSNTFFTNLGICVAYLIINAYAYGVPFLCEDKIKTLTNLLFLLLMWPILAYAMDLFWYGLEKIFSKIKSLWENKK